MPNYLGSGACFFLAALGIFGAVSDAEVFDGAQLEIVPKIPDLTERSVDSQLLPNIAISYFDQEAGNTIQNPNQKRQLLPWQRGSNPTQLIPSRQRQNPSQPVPSQGQNPSQQGQYPYQPQQGQYPSQPQQGQYPYQPQQGQYPPQPQQGQSGSQRGPNPSQPSSSQRGQNPSQPSSSQRGQNPSQPLPSQQGQYPSQPQQGQYPSQPQQGQPASQRGQNPSQPISSQQGQYPPQFPTQPQQYPPNQPGNNQPNSAPQWQGGQQSSKPPMNQPVSISSQPYQPTPTGSPRYGNEPSVVTVFSTVYTSLASKPSAAGGSRPSSSSGGKASSSPRPGLIPFLPLGAGSRNPTSSSSSQGLSVTTDDTKTVHCRPYPDLVTVDESRMIVYSRPTSIKVDCWATASLSGDLGKIRGDDVWLHSSQGCWVHESTLQQSQDYTKRLQKCQSVPEHWVAELLPQVKNQECYAAPSRNSANVNVGNNRKVDISCVAYGDSIQGNSMWLKAKDQNCYLPAANYDNNKYRGTRGPNCQ